MYSNEITESLEKGVMHKYIHNKKHSQQIKPRLVPNTVNNNLETLRDGSHEEWPEAKDHAVLQQDIVQIPQGLSRSAGGLLDTRNMNCSMIYASLAEKYRPVVMRIEHRSSSINPQPGPEVLQAFEEATPYQRYISPYNLEERGKKLNTPGGPDMPCICDPECICAPVCACDPTRNCLCEENGLFARVTEGMDIDDLDVPDLVRHKRLSCETSRSSAGSLSSAEVSSNSPVNSLFDQYFDESSSEHNLETATETKPRQLQHHQAANNAEFAKIALMDDTLTEENGIWDYHNVTPLRLSSLSYREALRQPFAKQCDYPPKRSSVAQRLFSSRFSSVAVQKKASGLIHVGRDGNGPIKSIIVPRQTSRRSLANVSFKI